MTPDEPSTGTGPSPPGSEASVSGHAPLNLDYEVLRCIGRGSYGEVWLVRDRAGQYLACKVVYREQFDNDRPYEREYEGIRKFEPVSRRNESQVKILHVGRRNEAGYFYYIMELADDATAGQPFHPDHYIPRTLKSEVALKKKLPPAECVQIGVALCAALENLHENGLIHRDIKPANIIFVNGIPKLADIGLVTDLDLTLSYVGTEGFIPPEGPTSAQADIYGLGKVLYEISTGRDRLRFPELPTTLGDWPDREALLELNAVISTACQGDPRKRYQSARDMREELELLHAGGSVRRARTAKRQRVLALRIGAVALTLLAAIGAFLVVQKNRAAQTFAPLAVVTPRLAPPDASRVAEQEKAIQEAYRSELADGRAETRNRVARDLLQRSFSVNEPAPKMATLRVAATLAAEAGDPALVLDAVEVIGQHFLLDTLPLKVDLLVRASPHAGASAAAAALVEACLATGFSAIAQDAYPAAVKLAQLAQSSAQTAGSLHLARQAEFLGTEVARCQAGYESIKDAAAILRNRPQDPKASLEVGKFLCLVKNDWLGGLSLLAQGEDPALKALALSELQRRPVDPAQQTALGDQWWNLAQSGPRGAFQKRAKYWYLKALGNLAEPAKTARRHELAAKLDAVPFEYGEIQISSRVAAADVIDIYSDELHWRSVGLSTDRKVEYFLLPISRRGETKTVRNTGVTRYLPDGVNFANARLIVDHKPKRRGRAFLETVAEDHVRLHLSDPPTGAAEYQVTIAFDPGPR